MILEIFMIPVVHVVPVVLDITAMDPVPFELRLQMTPILTAFLSTFLRSNSATAVATATAAAETPQPWPGGGEKKIGHFRRFRQPSAFGQWGLHFAAVAGRQDGAAARVSTKGCEKVDLTFSNS